MHEMRAKTAVRSVISLSFLLVLSTGILCAQTFSNSGSISITQGSGNTVPSVYPSSAAPSSCTNAACITVSGLSGTLTSMSVTITYSALDLDQSFIDPALLIQSPDGTHMLDMLSDACGTTQAMVTAASNGGFTVTLEDSASALFPNASVCPTPFSSAYQPAHYNAGTADNFPSPGPGSSGYSIAGNGTGGTGTSTFTSTFGSLTGGTANAAGSLNGTWRLFAVDQGNDDNPTVISSWSITFVVTGGNAATTTTLQAGSPNPAFTSGTGSSVSFTAHVEKSDNSGPATTGTVTLHDNTTNTNLVTASVDSSGNATLTTTFATEGTHNVDAVYNGGTGFAASAASNTESQIAVNHATNPSNGTFCNTGGITVSSNAGGTPYPSMIVLGPTNIPGDTEPTLSGTIESVTVSLNGFNLQNGQELDDLGFLLQAPGSNTTNLSSSGNAFEFLSWAGNPFSSGSLTLSDTGTSQIPAFSAPTCSTCLPTDNHDEVGSSNSDLFPSPAPTSFVTAAPTGSGTFLTEFGGGGVSGTWSLYLDNRIIESGTLGTIGSWCLNFTTQVNAHPTATTVSGSPNPAKFTPPATTASVNLTATVSVTDSSGLTVNAGTVTFVDGSTNLGSGAVSNGVATLSTTLAEGTHHIVASYSGTDTGTEFGISSATFDQRVDTATTNPSTGSGAGPYTFCNTGAITVPGLGVDAGAASPYPSNIFVTNLPGTVNAVTVSLDNFSTKDQGDLLSLLVGPSGNNLDFFSLTGTNVSSAPTINLTFSDTASSLVTGNLSSSGSFKPTSLNTSLTYPQCPPNASDCANPPVGPPLASNPFTPTNKAATTGTAILGNANEAGVFGGTSSSTYNGNGTWSLYMDDGGPTGGGEVSNLSGWCVGITVNQPSVSVTKSHTATFTQGQQDVPFIVSITNNGPGATGNPTTNSANAFTVTDTLNSAFSYAGFSGTGWSCSAVGQTVTCQNDSAVAQDSSYPALVIDVNVSPTASTTTSISNQVSVSGGGANATTSNTDSVTILPAAVLAVVKTHTGTFTQGQTARWNIDVQNTASSGSTYGTISVSDSLPSGYTLNSYTSTGSAWSCSGTTAITCTTTAGISGGSNSSIFLVVNVPANSPILVSNTANAWGGGDVTHTSSATAVSSTDVVTVVQVPTAVTLSSGNNQSATIDTNFVNPLIALVTDAGSNPVPGVTVTFTAPTGLTSSLLFSNALTTTAAVTNGLGQASSGFMTANGIPGGPYNVQASAGSLTNNFQLTNLGKSLTSLASLSATAATIDVFGFGLTPPSGQLAFTDLTTGNPITAPVTLNTSNAVTAVQPQVTTSTGTNSLPDWTELGDINGDGKLDLIASLYQTDSIRVQLGNGDGTFQAATDIPIVTGFGPAEAHLVSLRGNGTLDLIVGSFNVNEIAVLLGNGNGTFQTPTFYTVGSATNYTLSLTTGDFNHDGHLDVAVVNGNDNNVSILLGNGSGSLTLQSPAISVGHDPVAIRAGDFNGDGYTDLAVANYNDGTVTTLLNNENGTFTKTSFTVGSGVHSGPEALAMQSSGSSLQLAVANYNDDTVSVYNSNGNGTFAAPKVTGVGKGPDDVNFADFNGIEELVVTNYTDGSVDLLIPSGSTYTLSGPFKVGTGPYSSAVGDIDLDGTPDLVVSNCFSNNTGVMLSGTQISVPYTGLSLTAGDSVSASYTPDGSSKYGSSTSSTATALARRRIGRR
ncbi:beta strand repeat-containing protein [Acidicapsa dinghuensis]|uniref:Beta strand repeat-containing protein n=1 Tax=Acidicapsa dinghuensis TaxID=2218256 RepID=A0ABW1EMQ2_9BACT|nr:FG-GAP-like repeat-containing protein [Acidicapsa dinghuensis]